MKRFAATLLTIALLIGLAMPASAAKAKAATLRLQLENGSVSIRDAAGVPVTYRKNMRLYSGYSVSTGDSSSAYILLDDSKAVKLDGNTSVLIKKSGRKLQVKLKAGQLIFNTTAPLESSETLEIRTSSMVVGVRGSSGIVSLREVIFVTGHGVVYYGGKCYLISAGQGFTPKTGVFSADVPSIPSIYLNEVRGDSILRSHIQAEGIYDPDELISAIPSAEQREEDERRAALHDLIIGGDDCVIVPAFEEKEGENVPLSYTITWMCEGKVLGTSTVNEGDTPAWSGAAPVKEADAAYSYTFNGWTPQLTPVTGDVTYTALFSKSARTYTVTWKDDSGNIIDTTTVAYGETPTHTVPTKAPTDTASYEFLGWDPQIAAVSGDAAYTAVFEATYDFRSIIPQGTDDLPYDIYFRMEGNTAITTAKEGETFTFYLRGEDDVIFCVIRLNGVELGDENVYFSKEMDAIVCTFTVPKDPTIEIEPN